MKPPDPVRAARLQRRLQEIDAAVRAGDMAEAGRLAIRAADDRLEHPTVLNLAALTRFQEGRPREALALLKRARVVAPTDPHVLNALGLCLAELGRPQEALDAYGAAVAADPRYAAAHHNRASLLEHAGDLAGARKGYETALRLQPDYLEPMASLAWLEAQAGRVEAARRLASGALELRPGQPMASMALASAELGSAPAAAEARVRQILSAPGLPPNQHALALGLLGDACDAQGRTAEAFAAYEACGRELKTLHKAAYAGPGARNPVEDSRRLTHWFAASPPWARSAPAAAASDEPKAHVFLIGFPRSGTTLLETALSAHPEVVTLEERECLAGSTLAYLTSDRGLERLNALDGRDADLRRREYWQAVRACGVEPAGRVFVDKLPLNMMQLPLIARLFPAAKVLLARRDPRDVVLSGFRRRFDMNPAMYRLLTLEDAAEFYDAVMGLSEAYLAKLPLDVHVLRHEDLVAEFEARMRETCGFLGLGWSEALKDVAAAARRRAIDTPSAAQLARGLNREGVGAWRRYAAQMAPVLPRLQPWAAKFGYPPG